MGMFSSCAKQVELEDLLKWIEDHKQFNYDFGFEYINYEELVAELKSRIKAAEYD